MRSAIRSLLPGSIVVRTTLSIITLALMIGLLFATASGWLVQGHERQRLLTELEEQLSVVQQAVSIACFVQDTALAQEIGEGLMQNRAVAAVRISADGTALFESTAAFDAMLAHTETLSIRRAIHSPFAPDEAIGEVVLATSESVLKADAWAYTRYVLLALALEVALVALAVAWVVYNLITRPIKGISDELHHLELRTGMHLRVPPSHHEDEIGRLVNDVNALISRLSDLVDTERRLRLEREAGERRLAMVFNKVDAGLFTLDADGALQDWNPAFEQLLAVPAPRQRLQALLPAQLAQRVQDLIDDSRRSGGICEADLEMPSANGASRWLELVLTPLEDGGLQGLLNDVSARKHAELAAHQLASRDTLTGLLNRRGFDAALAQVFAQRRRASDPSIALMMIDLDHFKQANDTHGHAVGDDVLRRVAAILEAAVRRTDLVARQGGDEFVVALVGLDGPVQAERIATTIIDQISQPIRSNDVDIRIGASIGIAMVGTDETGPRSALERADRAMYAVKQAGRGHALLATTPD